MVLVAKTHIQYNPANPSHCVGEIALSTLEDVVKETEKAKQAFMQWSKTSPVERGEILRKAADLIEENIELIAQTATNEMGKTFLELTGEVKRGATILRYFAQEGMRAIGEMLPSANPSNVLYSLRVPVGVVGAITPWNFPVAIPLWKIAPALIYGNSVVWKPAIENGLTAQLIVECFEKAGLPENTLVLLQGGADIGSAIVENKHISAITFTGSNAVGQIIAKQAVALNKKYQLELGGKNAAIVLQDADLKQAAKLVIEGAMKQTGQRCTATSRVYIEEAVYEETLKLLCHEVAQIKLGIKMGPIVSKAQYEKILGYIEQAKDQGAQIITGGKAGTTPDLNEGYFIEPTILTNVTQDMSIMKEEVFGPVVAVMKVADYEEALAFTNDSAFGLSASLFTSTIQHAFDFINRVEVGLVQINGETGGAEPQAPFGGMKSSSSGSREQGQAAKEFFTTYKTVTINTK
ncbi:MAG TPA: aldehyde dehydrogenase family protein [Ureibacillus sp.]|nr:aldehyde dehydrogenase family protein [Ureibacillus sp.]